MVQQEESIKEENRTNDNEYFNLLKQLHHGHFGAEKCQGRNFLAQHSKERGRIREEVLCVSTNTKVF
jgi:hypothetical protein